MVLTPDLGAAERFYGDVMGMALVDKAAFRAPGGNEYEIMERS